MDRGAEGRKWTNFLLRGGNAGERASERASALKRVSKLLLPPRSPSAMQSLGILSGGAGGVSEKVRQRGGESRRDEIELVPGRG